MCDGCEMMPIVGSRWRATNLPDCDLCDSCKREYRGSKIKFEKVL